MPLSHDADPAYEDQTSSLPLQADATPGPDAVTGRRPRRARIALIAAAVILLLGALSACGYLFALDRTLGGNLKRDPSLLKGLTDRPAKPEGDAGKALNYLLIGSDSRAGEDGPIVDGERSDTIMIAHVTAKRDKVYLIAFPRDLYVPIPGHGKNKINAAYSVGDAPLLVSTLEQLTSVRIDHVAVIDFQGLRRLTTLVGGVTVNNAHASSVGSYHWPKGQITIQGDEALQYVRQRHGLPGGDLDRVERQQEVVRALMLRGTSRDTLSHPGRLLNLVRTGAQNVTVDDTLGQGEIRSTALSLRGVRGADIQFLQAPITGFGTTTAGASIDVLDTKRMTELSDAMLTDQVAQYLKVNPARSM
ncbi:LCP family protein [Angustibacter sp. McL0619]|uniref:LCP family protein n=1 Tax=Angustibacter sp. McL0619 TaxID=3415676 RepID=UPI003CEC7FB7